MTHEIITLQFGNYSNYIGAHYWNIQENQFVYSSQIKNNAEIPDLNHDILFREGLSFQNRLTYTPRMILFDLKDNINIFKPANQEIIQHKNNNTNNVKWSGKVQLFESETKEESEYSKDLRKIEHEEIELEKKKIKHDSPDFVTSKLKDDYDMDKQVKYWCDFMKQRYHDRSYILTNNYSNTFNDSVEPFDLYNYGINLFDDRYFSDDFEENLRHFGEECDYLQGFQFFVDAFNGFGGLAHKSLELVNEEFNKKPILAFMPFPFFDDQAVELNTLKLINTSLTLKSLLLDNSDLIAIPISLFDSFYLSKNLNPVKLDSVNYQPQLNYHTSAILASLIDLATLSYRQKSQQTYMFDIISMFDTHKYKVASLQGILPLDIEKDKYLFNFLQENDLHNISSWFTPLCSDNQTKKDTSQLSGSLSICCRGISDNQVKNPRDTFIYKETVPAHTVLSKYCEDMYPKSFSKCFSIQTPLNVDLPYPNIFNKIIKKPKTASLLTILQTNKSILNLLNHIQSKIEKLNLTKHSKYLENGMEIEDFNMLANFNKDLCDIYSI